MARRPADFDLISAIADPGFTPARRDLPALLDLLAAGATDERERAERALRRVGREVIPDAIARAEGAAPAARARLVALVGRLDGAEDAAEARAFLLRALEDPDAGVRRRAAAGLGRARQAPGTWPETATANAVAPREALASDDPGAVLDPMARDEAAGGAGSTEQLAAGGSDVGAAPAAGGGDVGAALAAALGREEDAGVRAALVEALGKVGGAEAEQALAGLDRAPPKDARGAAELRKARLRAARPAARLEASAVDLTRALGDAAHVLGGGARVWLDCRRGLAPVLLEEAAAFAPTVEHRVDGSAVVAVRHTGPLSDLFRARTWGTLALPGATVKVAPGADREAAAARALATGGACAAAASLTLGPLRYRIAWAAGGKRRAAVYRIAAAAAVLEPSLVNDPTGAPWEVVLRETETSIAAEWVPALEDPRFAYRQKDVPAASHPTIAAALAFLAGVEPGDVVWDPFVGSGLELCERALRGPYARLVGTDTEAAALDAARANLGACGAERFELKEHDVERGAPPRLTPTLVITNPPMGRRLHRRADIRSFLTDAVRAVARALAPRGRFVWVSPFPGDTRAAATAAGLVFARGHLVDLGGFDAEIQVFRRA